MISIYYPRIIHRELANRGRATSRLWRCTGLSEAALTERAYISDDAFHRLFANALLISGDQSFGLKVGARSLPFSGGDAGIATVSAPDLLSSLTSFSNFVRLRASYISVEVASVLENNEYFYRIRGIEHGDLGDSRTSQLEVLAFTMKNTIEMVLGRTLTEACYHFPFSEPSYVAEYVAAFGATCLFNSEFTGVDVPMSLGKQLCPAYEQAQWEIAISRCNELMDELASPALPLYSQRVAEYLQCSTLPLPGMHEVAKFLHMSERSLHRRLQLEEQNYRDIRGNVLQGWAKHYVGSSVMTIDAIASLMGYKDSANFRRAFRKWMGCTPSEFRAKQQ